ILYEQAQQRAGDEGLTADQQRQVEEQAWEDVVNLSLLRSEAARRGIRLTDSELVEFIRNNPPPEVARLPAFQTDGQFDIEKYRQALGDPALQATWSEYERQLRQTLPIRKLEEQIIAGVTVTDAEVLDVYKERTERARIRYVHLDPERLVPESEVQVSETEIAEYYAQHRDEYRREASSRIEYAVFRPSVTAADSAAARARADSLARAARESDAEFGELAADASDDELTRENGGGLGWFELSTMDPAIATAVEGMEPGEVSEPVQTPFGWHVLKLEDRMAQPRSPARYNASHILVEVAPTPEARDAARQTAQTFALAMSESAETFRSRGAGEAARVDRTPLFERGPVVPGIGPAPSVAEFAFSNDTGAVSGPLEHGGAFYVVHVLERHPAGSIAREQVADEIRAELVRRKRQARVAEMAPRFRETVQREGLEAAAQSAGLDVVTTGWFTRQNNIPGIGSGTPVAGAAFGLAQGQVAGPVEGPRGLYFIQLLEKQPYDPIAYERERASLREQLKVTEMRSTFNAWFEDLREKAEIEDRRAQLLGT
ncbi:MAG TPA: peptidyl-prolyl cis-trans isomerase, partial [Gemmatimonadota bacterium]|nr:peptidyl-prolyl cis-trans isomerase [Gemmatimonadota bacterium]